MPEGTPRVCAFDGCESHVFGRGWCSAHYMQWYKGKPLTPVKRRNRPGVEKVEPGSVRACIVEGCVRVRRARGLCGAHHEQQRQGLELRPVHELRECSFEGCTRKSKVKGICAVHKTEGIRQGLIEPPPKYRMVNSEGYALLYDPLHPNSFQGGWVTEHIVVMSELLGRPLAPGEEVHHLNGQRADNCPENLELWAKSQPKGQRARDLLAWAEEIVARYGPERAKL
jgi:hypothetical protein